MDLAGHIGQQLTLFGVADNAMAGAVLRCGPDTHVYIDRLTTWSDVDLYAAFEVTGTLIEAGTDVMAEPADFLVARLGRHYVLTDPQCRRLPPPDTLEP